MRSVNLNWFPQIRRQQRFWDNIMPAGRSRLAKMRFVGSFLACLFTVHAESASHRRAARFKIWPYARIADERTLGERESRSVGELVNQFVEDLRRGRISHRLALKKNSRPVDRPAAKKSSVTT